MKEDPYNLRPVWDAILEVYKPFAEICKKHHLRMWATYGTVLGAVRHKGFIPWDDDFDVMMPREDFERFLSIADRELKNGLKLITWRNTPEYVPKLFAKVQDVNRNRVEEVERRIGMILPQGIYIDVFPLDGWPERDLSALLFRFKVVLLTVMASSFLGVFEKARLKTIVARLIGLVCRVLCFGFASRDRIMKWLERICKSNHFKDSYLVGHIPDGNVGGQLFPRECLGDGVTVEFEGVSVRVPSDSDSYLRSIYGDYLKLPPESKRVPTHAGGKSVKWKFGALQKIV